MYLCSVCGKSFSRKNVCRRHELNVHHKLGMQTCKVCKKNMRSDNLVKHMETHTERKAKTISCEYCGMVFPSNTLLNVHRGDVHGKFYSSIKYTYLITTILNNRTHGDKRANSTYYKLGNQIL